MNGGTLKRNFGVFLLVAVFGVAAVRLALRPGDQTRDGRVVIRMAHYLVHKSIRASFEGIVADFESTHPDVRIVMTDVPDRAWAVWRRTQLIGGNAPDIIQLGLGLKDQELARYFRPLGDVIAQPNPYNEGTALAGVPWRETFIDNLDGTESYSANLMEHFGVATYGSSARMFFNRDLLRQSTGREEVPDDFGEFLEMCDEIAAYAQANSPHMAVIAAGDVAGANCLSGVFSEMTQRVMPRIARTPPDWSFIRRNVGLRTTAWGQLEDAWRVDSPAIRPIWETMRRVGCYFQPGFLQMKREDAGFYFKQGLAVMIPSGSWDAQFLMKDNPFEVGVFGFPHPEPSDLRYGAGTLGRASEATGTFTGVFGISQSSRNPEVALDFLRYLTSARVNERFAAECMRIPAIRTVPIPSSIAAFAPDRDGWWHGLNPSLRGYGGNWTLGLLQRNLDELVASNGSVERFLDLVAERYPEMVRKDVQHDLRLTWESCQRAEVVAAALRAWEAVAPGGGVAVERLRALSEVQAIQEAECYQMEILLRQQREGGGATRPTLDTRKP